MIATVLEDMRIQTTSDGDDDVMYLTRQISAELI
jgi:hypothetical protein